MTRKQFLMLVPMTAAAPWAANPAALGAAPTAGQLIERIRKQAGVTPPPNTVDTIRAGNPQTPATGIATTFTDSLDVLKRAAAAGKNLIVTHEPTFYNHRDLTTGLEHDPDCLTKLRFIEDHGMVVWRFHDTWHMRKPDGILAGMTHALGWESYATRANAQLFVHPETTLEALANEIRERLHIRVMRVVGDRGMKVTRIGFLPGAAGAEAQIAMLERPDVQVLLAGEAREWETVMYTCDAVTKGLGKALILTGHERSEEAGMAECARWLKTFIPEVPVEFIPAGEPFWAPA